MQLVLRAAGDWVVRTVGEGQRITAPSSKGEVVIEVQPLRPLPDDLRVWIDHSLLRGTPMGSKLRDVLPVPAHNDLGWPMEVASATVTDSSGNPIEWRLGVFFQFLEYAGCAVACASSAQIIDLVKPEVVAAFQTARPDWKGPTYVAAISELWD